MTTGFSTASHSNLFTPNIRTVVLVGFLCLAAPFQAAAQGTQWQGVTSSSWWVASNWSSGVPDSTKNTTVSVDTTIADKFNLIVPAPQSGDTARVKDLTIQQTGTVLFAPSPSPGILIVHGSVLSLNGSLLRLGAGSILFKGDIQLNGGGEIYADSGTLEFQGDINAQSGTSFSSGTSTVILSGSGNQSISGDLEFYDLVVETGGTVTLNGIVSVNGTVTVESGSTLLVESSGTFNYEGTIEGGGTFVDEGALPVQLTGFTTMNKGSTVVLLWSTATEEQNLGFTVERREVGVLGTPSWKKIGFVYGAGTSSSPRAYSYIDLNVPVGRYAYQLVQIDRDGSTETSFEAELQVLPPDATGLLSTYPNPFNPQTTIGYLVATDALIRLSVYDVRGREVAILVNEQQQAGTYSVDWTASHLPSGSYYARMQADGRGWTRQLLLLK